MSVEAKTANEVTFSLKLLVNPKTKKVVFAEAKKDFVDFLFHILSLPLTAVAKMLINEEMTGSLQSLYKSVESLQTECFLSNLNCDTVLHPKHIISLPFLSFHHAPANLIHFKCVSHNCVSDRSGETCTAQVFKSGYGNKPCGQLMYQVTSTCVAPSSSSNVHPGFVKEAVPFIVMDNLEVKPMSLTLIKSLLTDFDYLEENEVQFCQKEGFALLRAFLETSDVLTTLFLGNKKKTDK